MSNMLSKLQPPEGSVKKKRRVGRGAGSNWGKTAARGHKGHGSRSGGGVHPRFEGGQMPIQRRLPKRGFHNPFRREYVVLNVKDINRFEPHTTIDIEMLQTKNLVPKNIKAGVKILGDGNVEIPLTVRVHRFSQSARKKIESAGGTVEVIESAK